ncbi:carboxylic acid transporter protein [Lactarius pseudohatsudake]|nr:carboxylic acid transporter protein [Lactarius pseudohatsudake]
MVLKLIRNLAPPRQTHDGERVPLLTALLSLSWLQLAQLFSGWLAQTCDSIDMFNVSLNVVRLKTEFHQDAGSVMMIVISLNSLFRIFGGVLFGIWSDRFGRKWPLVAILLFCSLLQLATAYTQTIEEFLILRSLSGLAMGGVWGITVSNGLENLPVETRGLASGILGQGYAVGYLISIIMSTYFATNNRHTWRVLFWTGSGMIALAAIVRAAIPESRAFLRANARREAQRRRTGQESRSIIREARLVLKTNWKSCLLYVGIITQVNAALHGSQDLYPDYLLKMKGFTIRQATIAAMVGSCGAIVGGVTAGSLSQIMGRRLTMILFLLLGAAFIPLWMLPSTFARLCIGVFWVQFGVQGTTGVVPIWLAELSPPGFCALFPGVIVQIGTMLGSGSGEIETILAGAKSLEKTIIVNGKTTVVPGYGTAMCIIFGLVTFLVIQVLLIASENHGSYFEARNTAFEEGNFNSHTLPQLRLEEEKKSPRLAVNHLDVDIGDRLW